MRRWREVPTLVCLVLLGLAAAAGAAMGRAPAAPKRELLEAEPGPVLSLPEERLFAADTGTLQSDPAPKKRPASVPEPAPEPLPPQPVQPPAPEPEPMGQTDEGGDFADALFIGDSRTVGLQEYGDVKGADFFASVGLSVYRIDSEQIGGDSLDTVLGRKQYGRIYVMLGINEAGTGTAESFGKKMAGLVDHIREKQPDATIYLQSILYVTEEKSRQDPIFNNDNLRSRNQALAELDNGTDVVYLEVNDALQDGAGNLPAEYSGDGVHLKAKYYSLWSDYLRTCETAGS